MSRPFHSRQYQSREPKHRRNGKIRAREVRVLDEAKRQLGVMSLNDAIRLATSQGQDLIEIAPTATPPVCRIMDYGKFLYEESKREKESRSHQVVTRVKEIQISPQISSNDFAVKLSHAIGFLCDDMKVRVKLRFHGRQKAHKEFGFEVMNRFVEAAAPYGKADSPPKMLGDRDLNAFISPLPRNKRAPNPNQEQPSPDGHPTKAPQAAPAKGKSSILDPSSPPPEPPPAEAQTL